MNRCDNVIRSQGQAEPLPCFCCKWEDVGILHDETGGYYECVCRMPDCRARIPGGSSREEAVDCWNKICRAVERGREAQNDQVLKAQLASAVRVLKLIRDRGSRYSDCPWDAETASVVARTFLEKIKPTV